MTDRTSAVSYDEWLSSAQALDAAFSDWYPVRPSSLKLVDDDRNPDCKAYVLKPFPGKDLTWRELLSRMELGIWTFYMSEEAWLYYLPAFLMFPRLDEGIIGCDLDIIGLPPADDDAIEAVSIETLLQALNEEQKRALKHHVYLHAMSCYDRKTFFDGYSLYLWENFWEDA